MRARNIKPGFFTNDTLALCSPLARLLFAGLWTIADRAGRLEDRPRRIKAELLPYDDCDTEALLEELRTHGFIIRYSNCIAKYIQVVNFERHQNPHVKEPPSSIPAPDEHQTSTVQEHGEHESRTEVATLIPDSGFRIPDSINPPSPLSGGRAARCASLSRFEDFWKAYPKKIAKPQCRAKWKSKGCEGFADRILESLEKQKPKWRDPEYIPHPLTWLNQERWDAEIDDADDFDIDDFLRRRDEACKPSTERH